MVLPQAKECPHLPTSTPANPRSLIGWLSNMKERNSKLLSRHKPHSNSSRDRLVRLQIRQILPTLERKKRHASRFEGHHSLKFHSEITATTIGRTPIRTWNLAKTRTKNHRGLAATYPNHEASIAQTISSSNSNRSNSSLLCEWRWRVCRGSRAPPPF